MLTNRPVIVPETSVITLVTRTKDDTAYLTIDGQMGEPLKQNDVVICRRSDHTLRLIRPPHLGFFDLLREKLSWGER
jgi:NAD+ kinase